MHRLAQPEPWPSSRRVLKRGCGESECSATKRIVLGVQRLSLRTVVQSPSPLSRNSSMEIINGSVFAADSDARSMDSDDDDHSRQSQSSSQNSDVEWDYPRRTRSNSESKVPTYGTDWIDRERTWSLPRIARLREEDRTVNIGATAASLIRKSKLTLVRRASDPPRFRQARKEQGLNPGIADAGYSAGCECDSDAEDQMNCKHCVQVRN